MTNKETIWNKIKSQFLGKDESDRLQADDFSAQKNVIAQYRTEAEVEAKERRRMQAAPPPPAPPPSAPAPKPEYKVKTATIHTRAAVAPAKAESESRPQDPQPAATAPEPAMQPQPEPSPKRPKKLGISQTDKVSYSANRWQAPKILKTNLIKNEVTTFVNWGNYAKNAALTIFLSIFMVAALYFGLIYWETVANQEGESLLSEKENLEIQVSALERDIKEVNVFQHRLILAGKLLDNHLYWTNFFKTLEELIISEAYISNSFSSSLSGEYQFGLVVDSFESIYNQLRVLREHPAVLSAQVSSGNFIEGGTKDQADSAPKVEFNLSLRIDPNILFNRIEADEQ